MDEAIVNELSELYRKITTIWTKISSDTQTHWKSSVELNTKVQIRKNGEWSGVSRRKKKNIKDGKTEKKRSHGIALG